MQATKRRGEHGREVGLARPGPLEPALVGRKRRCRLPNAPKRAYRKIQDQVQNSIIHHQHFTNIQQF